ncbi:MAG TPA: sugar-binding protein, partial [Planctomycetota bacterium]|nr:sugar-binding protein [Planctomycetota bacterium]
VALQKSGGRDYAQVMRAVDGPTGLYLWTLMSAFEATGDTKYLDALAAAVPLLKEVYDRGNTLVGRWRDPTRYGTLLSCLIRALDLDEPFDRLDRAEVTKWIVDTTETFHKTLRRRPDGSLSLPAGCAGSSAMMFHAFAWVAALPDAPPWARDDVRGLLGVPAWRSTHPDEERFDYIRPGTLDGRITVCSTIEEGTEMFLWNSAETMALYGKVFGEAVALNVGDPLDAFFAEYGRACREDPDSIIPLEPEAPTREEMGDFPRIPVYRVVRAKTPPAIDGDPADPVWQHAAPMTGFTLQDRRGPSRLDTSVRLACDRDHLYVLVIAPDLKPPRENYPRDGKQWQDDGIEIFLDENFDRTSYAKIAVNLTGEPSDEYYVQPFLAMSEWNPAMRIGRRPGVIELAIPLKDFAGRWNANRQAKPEGRWSANFYRMGDGSSWVGYNMLLTSHIPQGFGILEFEEAADR